MNTDLLFETGLFEYHALQVYFNRSLNRAKRICMQGPSYRVPWLPSRSFQYLRNKINFLLNQ